jgi:ABC-type glycerol-3-phosphate transport system substrate-binding protein
MYEGQIYAVPRTIGTYFLVFNKKLLADIGVDASVFPEPDKDPIGWDAFIGVCDQIKASGKTAPLMFANKEGYFNEWYFYNFILQGFDTSEEIAVIGAGKSTWKQDPIYKALEAYKELYQKQFFVEGGEVVAYEQHVRQMGSGQCAMSVYFDQTGGATAAIAEAYGPEAVGLTRVPAYRTDKKLYGHSSLEPDAVYVTTFAANQDDAVKWLNFLVSLPEVNEMMKALQLAPADTRFDTSLVTDPQLAKLYKGAADKGSVYPLTLVTQAQYNALLQNGILYLSGRMSAEELCESFDAADKDYLSQQ